MCSIVIDIVESMISLVSTVFDLMYPQIANVLSSVIRMQMRLLASRLSYLMKNRDFFKWILTFIFSVGSWLSYLMID